MNPSRVPAMNIPVEQPLSVRPMSARMNRALSTRLPDSVRPDLIIEGLGNLTNRDMHVAPSIQSPIDEFQLSWLLSGNHQESLAKVAAHEKNEQRKQETMTEQVLADQLSRYVLSDAEQDFDRNKPILMQQQPRRNLDRRMHDTK